MPDTNKLSRRRFLKATGGAATAAALAGCTGGDGNETTTTEETSGGDTTTTEEQTGTELSGSVFNRILTGTITTMDPVAATDTSSGIVIQQVFDCLMSYPDALPTVENELATDYTASEDFTTYTFQLADATYHDGRKVKASDFVYAWERLVASDNSRRAYFVLDSIGIEHETDDEGDYVPGTLGLEAASETELVVNLSEPFHDTLEMLAYTSFAALPEGVVGDIDDYEGEMEYTEFASKNPIGAGPFEFTFWEKGTAAAVSKYDDYYGDVAQVDNVRWQVIEDDSARYNYAMNENADYFSLPTAQYDPGKTQVETTDDFGREIGKYGPVRNGKTVNYVGVPTLSIFYVGFNMDKVPKAVRQAFAYVLNQDQMVSEVFKGRGTPAYLFTPPTIFPGGAQAADDLVESEYPYSVAETDIQQAKQVMEDAGYGPDNKFEVQWTQYNSNTWEEMAKILRDQLASAHINMKIQKADFSTLLERGRNGQLEAYTLGWIADWPAADNFLQLLNPPQTDTSKQGPISYVNWTSENGDSTQKATDAYQKVVNNPAPTDEAQQVRDEGYLNIEKSNWDDVAMLPIYNRKDERFWYDAVDIEPFGGMGPSRQKLNKVQLNR
ncbi:putative dipeptides/oligopeptides ABC transporter periplasmic substrate-binding protein [Haloferax mucosum ATCC BAA-1512]|uniref:Putative dipeptides/oligopeptides ABC transporter periplasmic substrate-binding protein n=1 Tax=Haloferax mucosum ATCC BAA-1512 TaxID=662479 RepID=M0IEM5_9EURY|nr:ABC transporter substrate-binding protein [Haloferax mucosum]ELZ95221.1 putative dipeptides/oligopeptides ABC transporter periplasmic substrate-binding protein [Haloferax mucosum ATCC BAA-1512]